MCNIGNNYAIMRPFNTKTSACGHPHTAKDPTVTAKDPSVTYIQRLDLKSCHVAIHFRCDTPDLAVVESYYCSYLKKGAQRQGGPTQGRGLGLKILTSF